MPVAIARANDGFFAMKSFILRLQILIFSTQKNYHAVAFSKSYFFAFLLTLQDRDFTVERNTI